MSKKKLGKENMIKNVVKNLKILNVKFVVSLQDTIIGFAHDIMMKDDIR